MPTPPATPRTLKVLIGAGLLGLLIWQALPTPPNDSPPTPAPAAPRSRAPRLSAEATLALNRMPPPCGENSPRQ